MTPLQSEDLAIRPHHVGTSWLLRYAKHQYALLLPLLLIVIGGITYASILLFSEGGNVRELLAPRQVTGTLALFVLLSGFLLAAIPIQRKRTLRALNELKSLASIDDLQSTRHRLDHYPQPIAYAVLFGIALGLIQNPLFIKLFWETGEFHVLDLTFVLGSCLVWIIAGTLLTWRTYVDLALSRLGQNLSLDLYNLNELHPLTKIATGDVLMVAGAMAFTPLQSLDAEFRFGNYWSAIVIGGVAAIVVYLTPLWGLHKNIKATRNERIQALEQQLKMVDRSDLAQLELLVSHLDRIRSISTWPVNLALMTRILVYVIIPPLAWIAAALVENMIDSF